MKFEAKHLQQEYFAAIHYIAGWKESNIKSPSLIISCSKLYLYARAHTCMSIKLKYLYGVNL